MFSEKSLKFLDRYVADVPVNSNKILGRAVYRRQQAAYNNEDLQEALLDQTPTLVASASVSCILKA